MPICDRFEVLVEGRVESNSPALAEFLREWPFLTEAKVDDDECCDSRLAAVVGGWKDNGDIPVLSRPVLLGSLSLAEECALATDLAAACAVDSVGREKFCCWWRLVELLLD